MSPKHFFFTEAQQGTSNLDSRTGGEAITVTPNYPGNPEGREVFLGISMDWSGAKPGEAWAAVDADELRNALDKAVGPREEPEPWEGRKPYRPIDRDRLLRHIEDVEAALTRRNERHEQDQERIRELEAEVFTLREIKDSCEEPKTAREHLELAWEAAIVPEDGTIHAGEEFLCKDEYGIRQPALGPSSHSFPAGFLGVERRLLEPRAEEAEGLAPIVDEMLTAYWAGTLDGPAAANFLAERGVRAPASAGR